MGRSVILLVVLCLTQWIAGCSGTPSHSVCYVFGWNVAVLCEPDRMVGPRSGDTVQP